MNVTMTIISTSTAILLPPPEFNNLDSTDLMTKVKVAMDGSINSTIKTTTTQGQKFNLTFTNLTLRKMDELIAFLEEAIGERVTLDNWLGGSNIVKILGPIFEISTEGRGNGPVADVRKEASTITLELEIVP